MDFEKETKVDPNLPLRPCGCGVKIDLDHIVYPALRDFSAHYQNEMTREAEKRKDCFSTQKTFTNLKRFVFKDPDWHQVESELKDYIIKNRPEALIELFSSSFNLYREFDKLKNEFSDGQKNIFQTLDNIKKHLPSNVSISLGKGHSIQGNVHFVCLDFLELGKTGPGYTLANNDTIVTGDSILEPHSPTSVFIALNNALNDLLIYGGYHHLQIFPVYDGDADQVNFFKKAFILYQQFLKEKSVTVEIVDLGPLNVGAHLIGATAVGQTKNSFPGYDKTRPGQKILLTHFLGDLGLLSIHRSQFIKNSIDPKIAEERWEVMQKLTSPHFLMSEIVSEFLPKVNEEFCSDSHISFISDVSGPGLSVLTEMAEASQISVNLQDLKFNNPDILNFPRKNYTTSTNGPWLIVGEEGVIVKLMKKLQEAGFDEAHFIGETIRRDGKSAVNVSPSLLSQYQNGSYKYDLFSPNITVQTEIGSRILNCPLFPVIK